MLEDDAVSTPLMPEPQDDDIAKSSLQEIVSMKRRVSEVTGAMKRTTSSAFRVTKDDVGTQTTDLPSTDECVHIREVHNRIRQFSNLMQLWTEDIKSFDFVAEWVGPALDEDTKMDVAEAYEEEEALLLAMKEEVQAMLDSADVTQEAKVENFKSISDRQKLIFLRRVRRMQEVAVKEQVGRKVLFKEMNQRGINDDNVENNLFVLPGTLADSCVANLGRLFVYLRGVFTKQEGQSTIAAADGVDSLACDAFPSGQRHRTVYGLGNLPNEINTVVLPKDIEELQQIIRNNELKPLMKLKHNCNWDFGTDQLEQMKLIFLQRYCKVDVDEIMKGEQRQATAQTDNVKFFTDDHQHMIDSAAETITGLETKCASLEVQKHNLQMATDELMQQRQSPLGRERSLVNQAAEDALSPSSAHGTPELRQFSPVSRQKEPPGLSLPKSYRESLHNATVAARQGNTPQPAAKPSANRNSSAPLVQQSSGRAVQPSSSGGIAGQKPNVSTGMISFDTEHLGSASEVVDTASIMGAAMQGMKDVADRIGAEKAKVANPTSNDGTPVDTGRKGSGLQRALNQATLGTIPAVAPDEDGSGNAVMLKKSQSVRNTSTLPALRNGPLVIASPLNVCDPDLEDLAVHHSIGGSGSRSADLTRHAKSTSGHIPLPHEDSTKRMPLKSTTGKGSPHTNSQPPAPHGDRQSTHQSSSSKLLPVTDEPIGWANQRNQSRALVPLPNEDPSVGSLMLTATAAEAILVNAMLHSRLADVGRGINDSHHTLDNPWIVGNGVDSHGRRTTLTAIPSNNVGTLTQRSKSYDKYTALVTHFPESNNDGGPPRHRAHHMQQRYAGTGKQFKLAGPNTSNQHSMVSDVALVSPIPIDRSHLRKNISGVVAVQQEQHTPALMAAATGEIVAALRAADVSSRVYHENQNRLPSRATPAQLVHAASNQKLTSESAVAPGGVKLPPSSNVKPASTPTLDPVVKEKIDGRTGPTAMAAPQFSYL